jgi:hypothetical protein
MKNYRIYFDGSEREDVLNILRKYNDVIIDNVDDHSVGLTIELENSEILYRDLMAEIDREVFSMRTNSGI